MKSAFAETGRAWLSSIVAIALCAEYHASKQGRAATERLAFAATAESKSQTAVLVNWRPAKQAPGGEAPVTTARLQGALLDSIRDGEAIWAFSKDRFLLKLGDQPRSRALAGKLMGDGAKSARIEGKWRLEPSTGRMVLSDIHSDDQRGRPSVTLDTGPAGLLRVNIDSMQFNVFHIEHLLGRDSTFTQSNAKPPARWSFKWNPILSETGPFTIARDGEALPSPLVKALVGQEKPRTRIEGEWRWEYQWPRLELSKIASGESASKDNWPGNSPCSAVIRS